MNVTDTYTQTHTDRQTDRQTDDDIGRACIASRGNKIKSHCAL